jgi:hypothetical protein
MENKMNNASISGNSTTDGERTFWCQLFSDKVTSSLCDHRRRELDARGGFSCDECAQGKDGTSSVRS